MLFIFSHELQKSQGKRLHARFGFANHLSLIVCFHILQEVGVKWKVRLRPNHLYLLWNVLENV